MNKTLGLILTIGLGVGLYAGTFTAKTSTQMVTPSTKTVEGIQFFHGTWAEALAKAKSEKKLIFLDAMASWCGPCKSMAKHTFTEKEVGDFFNANFINVKMDMEKNADGERLSGKFGLQAYPTLYFVDSAENLVHQEIGMQKAKQLIKIGEKVMEAK